MQGNQGVKGVKGVEGVEDRTTPCTQYADNEAKNVG